MTIGTDKRSPGIFWQWSIIIKGNIETKNYLNQTDLQELPITLWQFQSHIRTVLCPGACFFSMQGPWTLDIVLSGFAEHILYSKPCSNCYAARGIKTNSVVLVRFPILKAIFLSENYHLCFCLLNSFTCVSDFAWCEINWTNSDCVVRLSRDSTGWESGPLPHCG